MNNLLEINSTFLFRKIYLLRNEVRGDESRLGHPEAVCDSFKIKIQNNIFFFFNALEPVSGSECLEIKLSCLSLMTWKLHTPV